VYSTHESADAQGKRRVHNARVDDTTFIGDIAPAFRSNYKNIDRISI